MDTEYTVGQYLVDRLSQLGLEHLFSIAGDYSIEWLNRYVTPSRIAIVEEVNEVNAGYAADGYARVKGIGALCVTYSAGALCAVNAVAGAYVERVPIVLINGTPDVKKTITFEQTGFSAHHFISGRETDRQSFEHITAAAVRLDNPDLATMLIDYALTRCITERRPVYMELLQDMVDLPCKPATGTLRPARRLSDRGGLEDSISRIRAALAEASRPLIWVGVEVDRFGLQEKTLSFIHQLKAPYVTELLSKSALPESDPLFAGVLDGQASSVVVRDLAKDCDFLLALGVWLTDINSLGWLPDPEKTAFVSCDAVKFGTFFSPQIALEHFIDELSASPVDTEPAPRWYKPDERALLPEVAGDEITYSGFFQAVAQYVDTNTIVGSDASLSYFGSLLLEVPAAGSFIAQSSYSAIGYIGAAATGLCLAKRSDQRVMVISGDGGFQMTAQCLSTQTRFGLNPIIFVINNGVYGVEQWLADASVFITERPFFGSCVLHPWNYSALATVFGCQGWRVDTYAALKSALDGALANADSPSIIDVVVASKSIPDNAKWKSELDMPDATLS